MRSFLLILTIVAALPAAARAQEGAAPAAPEGDRLELVDFRNAKIENVLRAIGEFGNLDIVLSPDVKEKRVSLRATDIRPEDVIESLMRTSGFEQRKHGDVIEIFAPPVAPPVDPNKVVAGSLRAFRLRYADAAKVKATLDKVLSAGATVPAEVFAAGNATGGIGQNVTLDVPTQTIVVRAPKEIMDEIEAIVQILDVRPRIIRIETRIVERVITDSEQVGMDWIMKLGVSGAKVPTTFPIQTRLLDQEVSGFRPKVQQSTTGTGGTAATTVGNENWPAATAAEFKFGSLDASSFALVMEAIKTSGEAHLVATPELTTVDNSVSKINIGQRVPVPLFSTVAGASGSPVTTVTGFEEVEVGTILTVLPRVNDDDMITLTIAPEISSIVRFVGPNEERPLVSTRQVQTTVMIQNEHTLVIGGLLQTSKNTVEKKVPLLGDIPLLGRLFRHSSETTERTELLIFITPRILD